MVSEYFLNIVMSLWEQISPGVVADKFEPQGYGWQDLCSEPLCECYILNIEAVGFMVSEKVF